LDEIKSNGWLRNKLKVNQRVKFDNSIKIFEFQDNFSWMFNALSNLADPTKEKPKDFFEIAAKYGVSDKHFAHMYFETIVFLYLLHSERIKQVILLILKQKRGLVEDKTLPSFFNEIRSAAPKPIAQIEEQIDFGLRNAIAHGWFWFENKKIKYYNSLEKHPKELELYELMQKGKKLNILATCFLGILADRSRKGFFKRSPKVKIKRVLKRVKEQ